MQYNEGGTHNNLRDFQNPTNIIAEVILICLHRNTLQQDHLNLTQGNHQAPIKQNHGNKAVRTVARS